MTQEEKQLLLVDLCGRLPYVVFMGNKEWNRVPYQLTCDEVQYAMMTDDWDDVPYLRPMSSMTEEEVIEFNNIPSTKNYQIVKGDLPWDVANYKQIDWLNRKMFDFRGLIPLGSAIEAPEGMYNEE